MSREQEEYKFTKADNDGVKSILVPISTLTDILDKMTISQSDLLEFMKANDASHANEASNLVDVVGRVSFVIGAVKYYLQ